ncbi:MAG: M36 family metallopeptidase, partial [Bacteroidia bacterium]|nr:M36 family metallopeptidase [Bacteroidia bacterium]
VKVAPSTASEAWNYYIDVATGEIVEKKDIMIQCVFDDHDHDDSFCHSSEQSTSLNVPQRSEAIRKVVSEIESTDNASYRVYPIPGLSPDHIGRFLITNPADPMESPFGWHDTDGVVGPEYTITRGNNVHAVLDRDGDRNADVPEPDGGAGLIFDYAINLDNEPETYGDASTVNLFYMNNVMHDFAAKYGFDEAAGNFQENNYGSSGAANDFVKAFAQSEADNDPSEDTRNNARWLPAADGFRPAMEMFVWERNVAGLQLLRIITPTNIAGTYSGTPASFGPQLPTDGITGQVAIVDDGTSQGGLGCNPLVNQGEINGKIALIDRGICNFDLKVQNAANAGAIAVVVCNIEDDLISMTGSINSGIPAVMVGNTDCIRLKSNIDNGLQIKLEIPRNTGAEQRDGTLDNGIVAHEYGHGISTRLVGGPQRAGCLSRDEQMGEGWSDFFTLTMAAQFGDKGSDPRGIGTFVKRENTNGLGIRRFPYTTDMSINPLTFSDIIFTGSSPHRLGEVWCVMIWDLYWALADRDGFDPDVYNGTGGNNTAIQLVMDGMKLLDCSPSFTDARDGILAADVANNAGANQCLIWEVFARRGLGYSAQGGDSNDRTDGTEAFDMPPSCSPELKITKTATELINPSETITVTLEIRNDKPSEATDVVVKDIIPTDASYQNNSASQAVQVNGDQLTFNVGSIISGGTHTISYVLNTAGNNFSDFIWYDGIEDGTGKWVDEIIDGKEGWKATTTKANVGDNAFFVKNDTVLSDVVLQNSAPVSLNGKSFPVLRFHHWVNSEIGYDPGIVQLSRNGGTTWANAGDLIYKNGYTGKIPYQPFAIPNQSGYYGDSGGWKDSYIDLRDYIGDDLLFRFRFGSDNSTAVEGWYVDEVAVFDMKTYQSSACATSAQGDNVCDELPYFGTVINYDLTIDVDDVIDQSFSMNIFPNPTEDWLNITITGDILFSRFSYKVFNISGKTLSAGDLDASAKTQSQVLDVRYLPSGMYFVTFRLDDEFVTKKFVKN